MMKLTQKSIKFYSLILILTAFCTLNLTAQDTPVNKIMKRIYTTKKLVKTPVIDGEISEDAWNTVEWSSDFVEKTPNEGTEPTHQTKFKVIYDAKFLYVAIVAFDKNPELIQQRLTRRDGFAGDRVNVMIDSYHDKRTAFIFTTTAAGVKGEEIATGNGNNIGRPEPDGRVVPSSTSACDQSNSSPSTVSRKRLKPNSGKTLALHDPLAVFKSILCIAIPSFRLSHGYAVNSSLKRQSCS